MERVEKPKFTMKHLLYFIFLNIIITTDIGFTAPLISKMATVFGVTVQHIAWLISIMAIAAAVFMPLWGVIADKVNRIYLIFLIVLSGAIISLFTVFTISWQSEFWIFGTMRFLAVVINTSLGPAVFTLLADLVPSKNRGGVIGWMGIAGTAAIGLGFIVSGILPPLFYGSDFPLEFPFWFDFFAGLIFCGLTLLLKEPKRGVQEEGLEEFYQRGESYTFTLTLKGALDFFRNSLNLKILLFHFLFITTSNLLGTYFITFLVEQHGVGEGFATLVMFIIFGIQLIGQIFWGQMGDKQYREKKNARLMVMIKSLGLGMFFIVPAFLIPFNFQERYWLFILFALVLSIGSFFSVGVNPNRGVLIADVNFPEVRATVNSIIFLAKTAATAIFVPIFATLAENTLLNYSGAYFLFIICCLPASFIVLISMRGSVIPNVEKIQIELKKRVENI